MLWQIVGSLRTLGLATKFYALPAFIKIALGLMPIMSCAVCLSLWWSWTFEHWTLGTNSDLFACMQMIVRGHGCTRDMDMQFAAVTIQADLRLARVEQLLLSLRHSRIRASSPIWPTLWLSKSRGAVRGYRTAPLDGLFILRYFFDFSRLKNRVRSRESGC